MNWIFIVISVVSGCLLGIIYFGGLWYTVKRIPDLPGRKMYVLIISSFIVRTFFVLLGFYFLLSFHWAYLLLAFLAFILTRQVVLRRFGKPANMLYG